MDKNVFYIHGSNQFLVRRAVSQFLTKKTGEGFCIEDISEFLPPLVFNFTGEKTLYCINLENSELDPDNILGWSENLDDSILLIFGFKSEKKLIKEIPKNQQREFLQPDIFKQAEYAESFFNSEIKALGNSISSDLTKSVIQKCGTDLGFLSFEALKVHHVATQSEINISDLQGVLSDFSEIPLAVFLDCLAELNLKRTLRTLARARTQLGPSGLVSLCAFCTPTVLKWLAAADLDARGVSLTESSASLGINPWYYENKVLPTARKWGLAKLKGFSSHLAKSQRLALSGAIDSWTYFETGLVLLLDNNFPLQGSTKSY